MAYASRRAYNRHNPSLARRPLSSASRPFTGPILRSSKGSTAVLAANVCLHARRLNRQDVLVDSPFPMPSGSSPSWRGRRSAMGAVGKTGAGTSDGGWWGQTSIWLAKTSGHRAEGPAPL